jgi:hypothetical protein
VFGQSRRAIFQGDGEQLPLSLEERAGVRTDVKPVGMREVVTQSWDLIAVDKPESRE